MKDPLAGPLNRVTRARSPRRARQVNVLLPDLKNLGARHFGFGALKGKGGGLVPSRLGNRGGPRVGDSG